MGKVVPLNCSKCGRFVGKDGFADVGYDYWNGGHEVGYPVCAKCIAKARQNNIVEKQANT